MSVMQFSEKSVKFEKKIRRLQKKIREKLKDENLKVRCLQRNFMKILRGVYYI